MVRGDHRHQSWVKWQGGTTGIKFGSNSKGGPQASNLGQIVRGDHRRHIWVKYVLINSLLHEAHVVQHGDVDASRHAQSVLGPECVNDKF